jgi:large subunit ribosomal protein L30
MKNSNKSSKKTMRIKLIKSLSGRLKSHKACAQGLGLKRIRQVVEVEDTACTRGMVNKINYLIELEDA